MYSLDSVQTARPSSLRRGVPTAVEKLIETCLQKAPKDRYGSARELLDGLRRLQGHDDEPTQTLEQTVRQAAESTAGLQLRELRGRLLAASSATELGRLRHEVSAFVDSHPAEVDGRILKDQIEEAYLRQSASAPVVRTQTSTTRWRALVASTLGVAFLGVVSVGAAGAAPAGRPRIVCRSGIRRRFAERDRPRPSSFSAPPPSRTVREST